MPFFLGIVRGSDDYRDGLQCRRTPRQEREKGGSPRSLGDGEEKCCFVRMDPSATGRFFVRATSLSIGASMRSFQACAALETKKLPPKRRAHNRMFSEAKESWQSRLAVCRSPNRWGKVDQEESSRRAEAREFLGGNP